MLIYVLQGNVIEAVFWPQMIPFELSFRVDGLSIFIAIISFIIWVAIFIYSIGYIKENILRYYTLLLLALGAVQDTFFAIDLVNFYVFLEMTTIFAYFLIIHNKDFTAQKAGYKYLLMSISGAFLILLSIFFSYQHTGNYELSGIIHCGYPIAPILFLTGCFIKAGAVPLHTWLPEAHPAAPTPISAFLSGIMIKIGVYGLIRVIFPINNPSIAINSNMVDLLNSTIIFIALLSIFIGGFLALLQENAKRLLAYSSVSQIGYILFGIGVGTQIGLTGGIYHIINHAIFKGLLFLSVGAAIFRVKSKNFDDLGGLWKKMPVTTIACIIAALSLSGIPPLGGYASKALIGKAVAEYNPILKYVLTFSSALTLAYVFKLIKFTFFGKENKFLSLLKEVHFYMLIPMLLLSFLCITLGLTANLIVNSFMPIAVNEIIFFQDSLNISFWSEKGVFIDTMLTVLLGFLIYYLSLKAGLIRREDKKQIMNIPLAKDISCASVDSLYCHLAKIVFNSCQRLNKAHSRDLNLHLSWIPLTFIILYLVLYFDFL